MPDPVPLRMNDATALKLLREIAQDSAKVIFTEHAKARLRGRKVTPVQVITCLQRGIISEPVALDLYGNWKLTVTHRVAGQNLDVAVAISVPDKAIVITLF